MPNGISWRRETPVKAPEGDDLLVGLIELLQSIDAEKPTAKLNETTIADNNGRRISL